jgi:hypothetical protein
MFGPTEAADHPERFVRTAEFTDGLGIAPRCRRCRGGRSAGGRTATSTRTPGGSYAPSNTSYAAPPRPRSR